MHVDDLPAARGSQPDRLSEVGPQERVLWRTVQQIVHPVPSLPTLDGPASQMVEQLPNLAQFFDTLIPDREQVIEVPKILSDGVLTRTPAREPELAEQLVEVPTIISVASLSSCGGLWSRTWPFQFLAVEGDPLAFQVFSPDRVQQRRSFLRSAFLSGLGSRSLIFPVEVFKVHAQDKVHLHHPHLQLVLLQSLELIRAECPSNPSCQWHSPLEPELLRGRHGFGCVCPLSDGCCLAQTRPSSGTSWVEGFLGSDMGCSCFFVVLVASVELASAYSFWSTLYLDDRGRLWGGWDVPLSCVTLQMLPEEFPILALALFAPGIWFIISVDLVPGSYSSLRLGVASEYGKLDFSGDVYFRGCNTWFDSGYMLCCSTWWLWTNCTLFPRCGRLES